MGQKSTGRRPATARLRIRRLGTRARLQPGDEVGRHHRPVDLHAELGQPERSPSSPIAAYAGQAAEVGPGLDPAAQVGAARGDLELRARPPAAPGPQRRRRCSRQASAATRGSAAAPRRPPSRWRRNSTSASSPLTPAVSRAATCPSPRNSRSSVCAHQSSRCGSLRPVQDGVRGEQRPALRVPAGLLGGPPGQRRGLGHLAASRRRRRAAGAGTGRRPRTRAATTSAGGTRSQASGIEEPRSPG